MIEMFNGLSAGQDVVIYTSIGNYRGKLLQVSAAVGLYSLTLPEGREIRLKVSDVYALELI